MIDSSFFQFFIEVFQVEYWVNFSLEWLDGSIVFIFFNECGVVVKCLI